MKIDQKFEEIMNHVLSGKGPGKDDCKYLLSFEPHSLEANYTMSLANDICRKRLGNSGIIYAQVGIDISPCNAKCRFCSFSADYFKEPAQRMSYEEIESIMSKIGSQEDVFGVFLMTMHNFDMDYLLNAVKISRKTLPRHVKLWINTGDLSLEQAIELKNAGVEGAYHVLRLREGEDTRLKPEKRLKTYTAIKESGLALYTCCEPIGAEHSVDEIIDRVFMAYEYGIVQQSVMRRTYIPGLPISKRGQISRLRLAQITATVTLSTISYPNVMAVASHEPNLLSLTAGSNITAAEFGKNPRDDMNHKVSEYSLSINECRKMLYEAGYSSIMSANYNQIPLTEEYINQCLSEF